MPSRHRFRDAAFAAPPRPTKAVRAPGEFGYAVTRAAAVALDVDGVLIDSAAVHRRVWAAWAEVHGLDPEVVWRETFGRRPEDTVAAVGRGLDPAVERRALDDLLQAHEHHIEAFCGARA